MGGLQMASEKVKMLNSSNFDTEIASGVVLVDFWAPWCGPCRMQGPILDKVAEKVSAKVAKLNVDEAPDVAGRFGVQGIPTLIVFKDGKEVERFVGVQTEQTLVDTLTKYAG